MYFHCHSNFLTFGHNKLNVLQIDTIHMNNQKLFKKSRWASKIRGSMIFNKLTYNEPFSTYEAYKIYFGSTGKLDNLT